MQTAAFSPGFRLSPIDVGVLIAGTIGAAVLWSLTWWWGFVVGFVVMHFFFFCNIIRASRPLELGWAGVFLVCAIGTIVVEMPGWLVTIAASLGATLAVATVEMRKPSYHGVGWQRINPGLRTWWDANIAIQEKPPQHHSTEISDKQI